MKKIRQFFDKHFHNVFYKKHVVTVDENNNPVKVIEQKKSLLPVYCAIVLAIFIGCFLLIKFPAKIRFDLFGDIFSKLFVPDRFSLKTSEQWWDFLFSKACYQIWRTIEMILVSTIVGSVLCVPFYILASSNVVKNKVVNQIVRVVVNIIRTIPTFVLAVIGSVFFGYSESAGVFAMILFTFGIMFKLMYEFVETRDMNPYEVSLSNGANTVQAYRNSLHPDVLPMYISNVIYTFEINIRASVVLGFVGAGGIGQLLANAMESTQYDKIGAILVPLFILVVVLQFISSYMRRRNG